MGCVSTISNHANSGQDAYFPLLAFWSFLGVDAIWCTLVQKKTCHNVHLLAYESTYYKICSFMNNIDLE